jgi:hypothetical protein
MQTEGKKGRVVKTRWWWDQGQPENRRIQRHYLRRSFEKAVTDLLEEDRSM